MMSDSSAFTSIGSALGSSVVHFLWQGTLIGLVAVVALGCLRRSTAAVRYAVASGALVLCLASFLSTFFLTLTAPVEAIVSRSAAAGESASSAPAAGFDVALVAAWCWVVGAVCMAVRFALQCYAVKRLKTTAVSAPDARWERAFHTLKEQLGITRAVRLARSGLAEVPMVVGWFSPIVLVPVSAFTAMSPDQLRSLLAHELAHIRRHDHLINAAQAVVEIILFFHPVVWWISKQMRVEREFCCDDSSVRVMGDPKLIAEALAAVEALRITKPAASTVLASNGGPLMQRITRILGIAHQDRSPAGWQLPAGLLLAGFVAVAGSAYARPAVGDEPVVRVQKSQDRESEAKAKFEAVEADLKAAVEAGKMTREQAAKKLTEVRERLFGDRPAKPVQARRGITVEQYKRAADELKQAVDAGRIKPEDAEARLLEMRKLVVRERSDEVKELGRRIELAVERGEITPEEGKLKMEQLHAELAERKAAGEKRLHAAMQRIEAAVKAGEMTPEEGKQQLADLKKRMAPAVTTERFVGKETGAELHAHNHVAEQERYHAIEARVKKALESGQMSREEAQEVLEGARKRLDSAQKARDVEARARQIKEAVKAGKLTREEAGKKLAELKQAAADNKKATSAKDELAEVTRQIEEAVKAGKLTREEGAAKLAAYEKKLAEKKLKPRERK